MKKAQCYLIRHLKKGIITEHVFLEQPDDAKLVEICGKEDVAAGLVRVVPSTVYSSNKLLSKAFDSLDPVPVHSPSVPVLDRTLKLVASGVGTVTNRS